MFNTTHHTTTVTPVTRVVEKTISPDRVVDMYDEVKSSFLKNIVKTHVSDGNLLKGIVIKQGIDDMGRPGLFFIAFTLNGKEYTFEERLADTIPSELEMMRLLAEKIAQGVTRVICAELYKQLKK